MQGVWVIWRRPERALFFKSVVCFQIVFLGFLIVLDPLVQRYRSCEDVAMLINKTAPSAPVIVFGFYPQDLPVYMGRTVKVLSYEGELAFGHKIAPENDCLITSEHFRTLSAQQSCFVFMLVRDVDLFKKRFSDIMCSFEVFYHNPPYAVFIHKEL